MQEARGVRKKISLELFRLIRPLREQNEPVIGFYGRRALQGELGDHYRKEGVAFLSRRVYILSDILKGTLKANLYRL